jgi:hypothetical protein
MDLRGSNYKFLRIMIVLAVVWVVTACTWAFYPFSPPAQQPETFLLAADAFPERWIAEEFSDNEQFDNASAGASQLYILVPNPALRRNDHVASHRVYSFSSFTFAHKAYAALINEWSYERVITLDTGEWSIPTELANVHPQADESLERCTRAAFRFEQPVELCVVVARYGQYVSEFWYIRDLAALTSDDVNTIFTTIDTNFTR